MIRKDDHILGMFSITLIDLPSPSSISYLWNFGSLLGVFLVVQVLTGLILSIHFYGESSLSFFSVIHMVRDVEGGWFLRVAHSNGASLFFMFLYLHIGRGLYYGSYRMSKTWVSGVSIFLLVMITAFLGYVLPWGQMSFWAATVITNLLSVVPYIGVLLVEWIWGGFAVGNPTLSRFFAFHFMLPFVVMCVVIVHLVYLHEKGSGNPLGLSGSVDMVIFHEVYSIKDLLGLVLAFLGYVILCVLGPYVFMDSENFIMSNPLVTPVHIQPEWYFLFAYAILRSVPSSVGGVVALVMSVMILYFLPFFLVNGFQSSCLNKMVSSIMWMMVVVWLMLTWIGSSEVDYPFFEVGKVLSVLYFLVFIELKIFMEFQDKFSWWL